MIVSGAAIAALLALLVALREGSEVFLIGALSALLIALLVYNWKRDRRWR